MCPPERLYRTDYATFEDYCRGRWGMTHRHVNRQIIAAEVVAALGPIGPKITESQARELADRGIDFGATPGEMVDP